jgi:arsenite methyltransferase
LDKYYATYLCVFCGKSYMTDKWKEWILTHRQSGADNYKIALEEFFVPLREKLLDRAKIKAGETVLDVGTGDGLVGFGAVERVGLEGKVIFSDISEPLLDLCHTAAKDLGILDRCEFSMMSADKLDLPDNSVDVVTTRSVLIYLPDKKKCLQEFYRVLRPGGRISLFEPVADIYMALGRGRLLMGLEVDVSLEIMKKLSEGRKTVGGGKDSTLGGFDDRDFFRWADECGFSEIDVQIQLTKKHNPAPPLEHFLTVRLNPLASTMQEIMDAVLTEDEKSTLIGCMEEAIPKGVLDYMAAMYFSAIKGGSFQTDTNIRFRR